MKPTIHIHIQHFPGYGNPESWTLTATYANKLLETVRVRYESDLSLAEHNLKKKWAHEWDKDAFAKAIKRKPNASPICSNCGKPTLNSGMSSSVNTKVFCGRPKCQEVIPAYQQQLRDEDEARRVKSEAAWQRQLADSAKRAEEAKSGFHWTDGWFFKRMPDGAVRVSKVTGTTLEEQATIDPLSWASIVCSVSALGETGERWDASQDFHGRMSPAEGG